MEQVTLQQGLNSVVINKVQRMIENKQTGVRETLQRLAHEGQIAQDYIAPLGVELRQKEHSPVIRFSSDGELMMNMRHQQFTLHDNAVGQLAEKMNVPSQYLRALAHGNEWQRHLAATVLNEHSSWTECQRVLVRSIGTEVRGVLGDGYRRLNSVEILTAFMEEASRQGAVVADAKMTDIKIWTETILPMPITIPTLRNCLKIFFKNFY
jgi:translation elongation factor EF-G